MRPRIAADSHISAVLQAELDRWHQRCGNGGAAVALRLNGEPLWRGSTGDSLPYDAQPLDPGGSFLIYSISKTFTAASLLRLEEAGHLAIDQPVAEWFPDLALDGRMTIRHLLNHTGGLPD